MALSLDAKQSEFFRNIRNPKKPNFDRLARAQLLDLPGHHERDREQCCNLLKDDSDQHYSHIAHLYRYRLAVIEASAQALLG